jgi:hypothetical protein
MQTLNWVYQQLNIDQNDINSKISLLEPIQEKNLESSDSEFLILWHKEPPEGKWSSWWFEKLQSKGYDVDGALSRGLRSMAVLEQGWKKFGRTGWVLKKKKKFIPTKNAVITYIAGDRFVANPGIDIYFKSLTENWKDDILVFTHNLGLEGREKIQKYGARIIDTDPSQIREIVIDRHYVFWKFLCNSSYENILHTDSKDVYFQNNPNEWFGRKKLILCAEGQFHKDSNWNTNDQETFQKGNGLNRDLSNQLVLNGGVQMGSREAFTNFCFTIFQGMRLNKALVSDQAYINFMYPELIHNNDILIAEPKKCNFALTGEAVKLGYIQSKLIDSHFFNIDLNKKYMLVHQWERTHLGQEIWEKYS